MKHADQTVPASAPAVTKPVPGHVITWRAFVLGVVITVLMSLISIWAANISRSRMIIAASQFPMLSYVLLFLMVLVLNPLCRLTRLVRPFTIAEILVVLLMGLVSSGIPLYGLMGEFLPLTSGLFNRDWNNEQSGWDQYILPYMNDHYFLSEPGIQAAAVEYRDALLARDKLKTLGAAPALLRAQEEVLAEKRNTLKALKEKAFLKVDLFRRGLPKEQQASPGILPQAGDDASTYFGRLQRLWHGEKARHSLEQFRDALVPKADGEALDVMAANNAAPLLAAAISELEPLASLQEVNHTKELLEHQRDDATARLAEAAKTLSSLNSTRRWAPFEKQAGLDEQINSLSAQQNGLENERKQMDERLQGCARQAELRQRVATVLTALHNLQTQLSVARTEKPAKPLEAGAVRATIDGLLAQFSSFDASYARYFVGEVPWGQWGGVLLRWGVVIALTYVLLMALNLLIYRQWTHNEKLIYPLMEFSEILVGFKDSRSGSVPEVMRSGLFWLGFAVSGVIMGWSLVAYTKIIPGLTPLNLGGSWSDYIAYTPLHGLLPFTHSEVFFTLIGLSFLIPAQVTFSLWFFEIVLFVQILALVWLGYAEARWSFPMNWHYALNMHTSEGSGAVVVFSAVVFYKCRQYLLAAFRPRVLAGLEPDERKELRLASFLFLGCSLALILVLWLGLGANFWYTIIVFCGMLMLTICMVRAVAEGGLLSFQALASPFHFIRNTFGCDKAWNAPGLFAPLVVYYAVFFQDIKSFIAPTMANCLKVREDLRMERGRFHLAIFSAIILAVVVSGAAMLILAYGYGANTMNQWFFGGFAADRLNNFNSLAMNAPAPMHPQTGWLVVGMLAMAGLLYARRFLFWIPHPLGMVMMVSPIMNCYWFSIFLGWLAKVLVTRYGNRDTYLRARGFFVGLIVGELAIVALALLLSYLMNAEIPIDMNKNW